MQISRSLLSNPALKAATVLAVSALALSACTNASETGTGGAASPSGSAAASFDPSTVQKDDALAAMVPEAIKAKGTLTVGSDTSYAPAEFLATDGQTPVGYDVDIAKAIGAALGLKVQVQGEELRVTSKSRDDLQAVIALVKAAELDFAVQCVNYR